MNWIEVKAVLQAAPDDWSPLIEIFRDHGCENTLQTDDPPTLSAAVVEVDGSEKVVGELSNALRQAGVAAVETRPLVDEDWDEHWKKFFKPRRIGRHFVIRPTWEAFRSEPDDHQIVLDPGQAFGTGDHPTTRLCLELLEDAGVEGKRVADVGCGSGILSIASCQLGAAYVAAVDIEPLSVEVAKENAALNGVSFKAVHGAGIEALASDGPWDVVVSNIISATLIAIARDVAADVKPGGLWIVSGVINANWPDVLTAAENAGFTLEERKEEDDWLAASLRRAQK
jgi:ribosomal protein L11 methyltransferase